MFALVTKEYNESLMFGPEENRLFFSIREPIVNRVYSTSRQRGFASRWVESPSLGSAGAACMCE